MMEKAFASLYRTYLTAKFRMMRFMQEEEGNDMVNTIIIVAISVIIAGILVTVLLGQNKDGKGGIIGSIFETIKEKLKSIFGDDWKDKTNS